MKMFLTLILTGITYVASAASVAQTVPKATAVMVPTALGGGCKVTGLVLTTPANQACVFSFWDANTNNPSFAYAAGSLWGTNSAYTSYTTYVTNKYSVWTNYYNVVNYSGTNVALVTASNWIAEAGFKLKNPLEISVGTNTSMTLSGLNLVFQNGVTVTNNTATVGSGTVTMTYEQ